MAEYIEREVVLDVLRKQYSGTWKGVPHYPDEIRAALRGVKTIPAADVAPVIRCKECSHVFACNCLSCGRGFSVYCGKFGRHMTVRDFCSYGERKEG